MADEVDELTGADDAAGAHDADVVVRLIDLLDAYRFHQRRVRALIRRENNTLGCSHADTRGATLGGLMSVFDLVESTIRREGRNPTVVRLLLRLSLHGISLEVKLHRVRGPI